MRRQGLVDEGFERYRKSTRRDQQPNQIHGACESRASVSGAQADLRFQQRTLPGFGQERQPDFCGLRADQSVPGTAPVVATRAGVVGLEFIVDPENQDTLQNMLQTRLESRLL
jgi:hypothetical protein